MEYGYPKIARQVAEYGTVQNLMHLVNKEALVNQHRLQEAKKAVGIDKVTKVQYAENLEANIDSLVMKMKQFSYKPLPVRRTLIPKIGSGKLRPLGIPAYEDKLVQGVMADILTAVYEPKFLNCSYGFRPNRSCHSAIKALNSNIMKDKTGWVVDADIMGFFDNVSHDWLIKFLEHDINDKNFIRYIKRFLKSGIMEQGKFIESDKGTPQGGVISPILANVYLHYVLDLWFEKTIKVKYKGMTKMTRYADDFVCCFQYENDAKNFYGMLKERLEKFGLSLAEEKSKIIRFGRFARTDGAGKDKFDFLGFTHINGKSKEGYYKVVHYTSEKKLKAKRQAVKSWLLENIHINKCELANKLNVKLIGHYRYYGITDNTVKMRRFHSYVKNTLYKMLNKRSQRRISWDKYIKFLEFNPIAIPKVYVSLWQSK